MNLFDKEFFPTPPEVIKKMVKPYADRLHKATILEPSAGNGAILEHITTEGIYKEYTTSRGKVFGDYVKADTDHCYAIEKNPELQMILQQKGYRVIATDFLKFRPEHRFDLILMNPPFSCGDSHLLHAWEILPGGDIACLLNAETIRNPYTNTRGRLKAIIERYGSVEFLGQVFKNADNPTDVEVALVRLHKEDRNDPFRIDTETFSKDNDPDFGSLANDSDQVAVNNQLDAYVRCWNLTKAAAVEFIKSFARFRFYANSFLSKEEGGKAVTNNLLDILKNLQYSKESMSNAYNRFLDSTKASAWNTIFSEIGLGKYMTTGLQRKLDEFRTAQGAVEISKENILALFNFIMVNIGNIMDQSVVEVYDMFTSYFVGNTACDEGWKTNKRFRCNRKIILPYMVSAGFEPQRYGYDEYYSVSWDSKSRLNDIDKAMCWLTGRNFNDLIDADLRSSGCFRRESGPDDTLGYAIQTIKVGDQGWHESAFFRIKAFKKGTIHLEFKDEDLWNRFNIAVNKGKNELGMAE